jgi:co-chaperonin GroES (HSP10)
LIKPMTYRVLVKPDNLEDEDKQFKSAKALGIVIPDHENIRLEQMKMDTGTVVAMGPTAFKAYAREAEVSPEHIDYWIKIGDRVGFAKYAGKAQTDPTTGTQYILLADEDINCVLEA